jgi:peptidoglycan/LPS O-acetylase OafA/YrhL
LFHVWPPLFPGGYVGVDVFFVISGYLITAHLVREVSRTGRISLPRFWARRARRLLPASLLVLLVTVLGVVLWVPQFFWLQFVRETIASALYVENWLLAGEAVNYLTADNSPTAVQHYWSLSVEEQFYLVWPLLILLALWLPVRVRRVDSTVLIAVVLGVATVVSLAYSVYVTAASPSAAYFVTPTRAWEFGTGGLLALGLARFDDRFTRLRPFAAWGGWALIAITVFGYSAGTPFPGATALLPVAGAVLVVAAGNPRQWWAPTTLAGLPPVQWVGDVSYSLYLWHWPLLIIAPFALGHTPLLLWEKVALIGVSLLLAWATKRWVEDPVREAGRLPRAKPRWTALAAVLAMALVIVPSLLGSAAVQVNVARDDAKRAMLSTNECFGAASMDPQLSCSNVKFPVISPDPAAAPQDSPDIYFTDPPCFAADAALVSCRFGDPDGALRVALIGDSHAAQWEPALRRLAERHGWDLELYLKTNCAFTDAKRTSQYGPCAEWSAALAKHLAQTKPYSLVMTSFFAENLNLEVDSGAVSLTSAISGFRSAWKPLTDRGATVVVLHDTPHMNQQTTVCVATKKDSPVCDVPRKAALARPDLQYDAADGIAGVARVDLNDWICDSLTCRAVIGGVALRTDPYHLTKTFAGTMTPYLYDALIDSLRRTKAPPKLIAALR